MHTSRRSLFTTITTEGALLPADLLEQISKGGPDIKGLAPQDYGLAPGEKLGEATSRSWNRLTGLWTGFRAALSTLPEGATAYPETQSRWLQPLFQELGFGRLPAAGTQEIAGKTYAISHMLGNVPIHLVGAGTSIDRRTAGVRGAASASPHSILQEFLNSSDQHLWGIVSNGLRLRILRDNSSLTRQAYVEFDLAAMMDGDVYSDFVLLWLVCHQSRFEGEKPEECWLEKWSHTAAEKGTRALDQLRNGVEASIKALGKGFLSHPDNVVLRDRLRSGALADQDYYRQLLRMVYRFIFLFVAEDRDLLFVPEAAPEVRKRYMDFYSMARLRRLAIKQRGTRHSDLYHSLRLVMRMLGEDAGCPDLGLPALNSFLFEGGGKGSMPDIDGAEIANHDLLEAVRELGYVVDGNVRRPVSYRSLGSEELGSVYESLLELHPLVSLAAGTFELATAGGNERKTTGSYYTPTSLINSLLDTALDPVLEEAARKPNPEQAILDLKVCDPACGSGHFLVAAAHRIAKRLASVRTGDDEPSPEAVRKALRDVIGRCIYGVDLNPMAVELCTVSLWMEALEPGKPLSFLEHHIQQGNSLLGAIPRLLKEGIPDEAFEPIEGDDKAVCSEYKKKNKQERTGQMRLLGFDMEEPFEQLGDIATSMLDIESYADDTTDDIHRKQRLYEDLVNSAAYEHMALLANAWCAAFVWKKTKDSYPITQDEFRRIRAKGTYAIPGWRKEEIDRLSEQYGFFHWHLQFPTVFRPAARGEQASNEQAGWMGGFDVVLGNPPWERVKTQEKEWFASRRPDIADAPNGDVRKSMIEALRVEDPPLFAAFLDELRQSAGDGHFALRSGRFPLCGRGDVNTYALFAETMWRILNETGRVGCVIPSGIATDDTTKFFFQDLLYRQALVSFYDFENRKKIFPAVQGNIKFCLFSLCASPQRAFLVSAQLDDPTLLRDATRQYALSTDDIRRMNPNTMNCPTFRAKRDAELVKAIYTRIPVLIRELMPEENRWGARPNAMFHMTNDSWLFRNLERLQGEGWNLNGAIFEQAGARYVPLYEAKLAYQYNHRAATFRGIPQAERFRTHAGTNAPTEEELTDPNFAILPRYWVPHSEILERVEADCRWLLGFRNAISAVADSRSFVASVIPLSGVGNSMPLLSAHAGAGAACALLSQMNSFVLDYVLRQKASGGNLNFYILKQLPFLGPADFASPTLWSPTDSVLGWILPRVLELTYTARDLESFAKDCGYNDLPFRWDEERRFLLRCELDATYFHLYGIARDDVDYIMETFPIVKRKDEAQHGEYRTKRVILEIYDAMQQAIDAGQPYQTLLDPPPAMGAKLSPPAQVAAKAPAPEIAKPAAVIAHSVAASPPTTAAPPVATTQASEQVAPASLPTDGQKMPVPTTKPTPVFGAAPPRLQQQSFVEPPMFTSFSVGDRVKHATFGEGQVLEVASSGQDQIVTVMFKTAGRRRLMAKMAGLERV